MRSAVLLVLTSTVLSLVAAELGLRQARPNWTIFFPPVCFRPDLYQQWDPYGYRLWPSRTVQQRYEGPPVRTISYRSNADGFRTRELHLRDDRRRIVLLGDSLPFGVGVEEDERLSERLEALEPSWRVDNLAMIGFGPDLMLRALDAVGLDPPPEVVVLMIFTDDIRRVSSLYAGAGFPIPRYVLSAGELTTIPYPTPWPWERTMLVQGLYYATWRYTAATWPLTEAILDRFRARAAERRFIPLVVFLPARRDGWDDRQREARVAGWAERTGTTYADLTPILHAPSDTPMYLPDGAHLTASAHARVARALRGLLATARERRKGEISP